MSKKASGYLTKVVFEKNATNGLDFHPTLESAVETIQDSLAVGATDARLFVCTEVNFEVETREVITLTEVNDDPSGE